jgi:leader peptidase (prepilin peptidase)/N-methyltransferase
VTIAIAALVAALLGAAGPFVMRRLPEPPEPDEDKVTYAALAETKGLTVGLALGAALMAGVVAWQIDHVELLPAWVLVAGVGSWLVFIDWRTRLLPYVIVAPTYLLTFALVGLGALLLQDLDVLKRAVIANVVVYGLYWVLYLASRRTFGYGDVRLSGVLGLALGALGTDEVYAGMYGGLLLNGVLAIALVVFWRVGRKNGFAFGPCMIVGAVAGAALAPTLYAT